MAENKIRYYKKTQDYYILSIGIGDNGTKITEEEYNTIQNSINSCPAPKSGYEYRLKTDLTWEEIKVETTPTDFEKLEAQTLYTALMTDTLLEG